MCKSCECLVFSERGMSGDGAKSLVSDSINGVVGVIYLMTGELAEALCIHTAITDAGRPVMVV